MNDALGKKIEMMAKSGRFPHSLILFGQKGIGKKHAAREIAGLILCDEFSGGVGCGKCRSCVLMSHASNPDLIEAVHSGKKGGISVAEVRRICADASVAPNNSENKVYLFCDSDYMESAAQNALLKIIEEPPDFVYFIFTVRDKETFLPTVLSRSVSLGVGAVSKSECLSALASLGFSESDSKRAFSAYGGNIGCCIESIESEAQKKLESAVSGFVRAISRGDEYGFIRQAFQIESDLSFVRDVLLRLSECVRDSSAKRLGESSIGIVGEDIDLLSEKLSFSAAGRIYGYICEANEMLDKNVGAKLVLNTLCGRIFA